MKRAILIIVLIAIVILTLTSCYVADETASDITCTSWATWHSENFGPVRERNRTTRIIEFPESFPEGITFETEFATYAPNVKLIRATLTNVGLEPHLYVWTGYLFELARLTDDGWLEFPLEGLVMMTSWGIPQGYDFIVTLENGCADWDVIEDINTPSTNNRYTNVPRLEPGVYRMFKDVAIGGGGFVESEWQGYVWAEFEVYG